MWAERVEEAVKLEQRLVVFYFPGEVGEGEVDWSDIVQHSLLRDEVMAKVHSRHPHASVSFSILNCYPSLQHMCVL